MTPVAARMNASAVQQALRTFSPMRAMLRILCKAGTRLALD
jgi:hypothetical protein